MLHPLLSCCIVSFNTSALTVNTIESIFKSTQKSELFAQKGSIEIIVVDNNSSDDSVEKIQAFSEIHTKYPIHISANSANLGFATANNKALEKARANLTLFLNSDTIVHAGSLEKLVAVARRNTDTLFAAQLHNTDNSHQPQGGDLPSLTTVIAQFFFLDDLPFFGSFLSSTQHTGRRAQKPIENTTQKGWIGATALIGDTDTLKKLGGFDEEMFLYGEDVELCIRAAKQGLERKILEIAPITHIQNASSSNSRAITGEILSLIYIWKKHYPRWQSPILKIILIKACLLRLALFWILRDTARVHGYSDALKQLLR